MALCSSGLSYQLREVLLNNKPRAMILISPKATVPVLQLETGDVIDQSLDIMVWALEKKDPDFWLTPEIGKLCNMLDLISEADTDFKFNLDRYKYPSRFGGVDPEFYRNEGEAFLGTLENFLEKNSYLFGRRASLADYAIFPFVRQFANTDRLWFDQSRYNSLQRWLNVIMENEYFLSIMRKHPVWKSGDPPIIV